MPTLVSVLEDTDWIDRLRSIAKPSISTVEDLLDRDPLEIATQCGCALEEVLAVQQRVALRLLSPSPQTTTEKVSLLDALSLSAQSVVPSAEEVTAQRQRCRGRSTGCAALDELCTGRGFAPAQLVAVLGDGKSGKTSLCAQSAAHTALSGQRVLVVNTCNHLTPTHIENALTQHFHTLQLVRAAHAPRNEQEKRERVDAALSRVFFCNAFSLWQALDLFSSLQARLRRRKRREEKKRERGRKREREREETQRNGKRERQTAPLRERDREGNGEQKNINNEDHAMRGEGEREEDKSESESEGEGEGEFDLVVVDSLHHWVAPLLSDVSSAERAPYASSSSSLSLSAAPAAPAVSSVVVNPHPLLAQLLLLFKAIATESARQTTFLVTNVVNREHFAFHQQRSFGPQSRSLSTNNAMMSAQRLSVMTGTGGPTHFLDVFDVVLCVSLCRRVVPLQDNALSVSGNNGNNGNNGVVNVQETEIEIGVVVRPPYWKDKPRRATLTLPSTVAPR